MEHLDIATQLALFLENRPGTLAKVCDSLAAAKINIFALTVSDTVDHSVVRVVVSDPRKALHLLEERGVLAVESEVLLVEGENKPGSLSKIAQRLSKAKVNIEYAYLATSPKAKRGLLVIRPSNARKALEALQDMFKA